MAKCSYCAKEITGWAGACPRCGRETKETPGERMTPPAPGVKIEPVKTDLKFNPKFKKETMMMILLADLCLVLGVIFYFIFKK